MTAFRNPALAHFLTQVGEGIVMAQVSIRPVAGGRWELRHHDDAAAEAVTLKSVAVPELRALAQTTAGGLISMSSMVNSRGIRLIYSAQATSTQAGILWPMLSAKQNCF